MENKLARPKRRISGKWKRSLCQRHDGRRWWVLLMGLRTWRRELHEGGIGMPEHARDCISCILCTHVGVNGPHAIGIILGTSLACIRSAGACMRGRGRHAWRVHGLHGRVHKVAHCLYGGMCIAACISRLLCLFSRACSEHHLPAAKHATPPSVCVRRKVHTCFHYRLQLQLIIPLAYSQQCPAGSWHPVF